MDLYASYSPPLKEFLVASPSRGLISIADMLRFYAAEFVTVTHNLELIRNRLLDAEFGTGMEVDWGQLELILNDIREVIKKLPLSHSLVVQVQRALDEAKKHDRVMIGHLRVVVGEISHNIVNELTAHLFLLVPSELKWFYLTPETLLGEVCESKFPEIVKDAHAGLRCYVVDEWTATVFHFMRVLELGLRWLSKEVGLTNPDINLENWKNILDQIEKEIRKMEALPRSPQKSEDLKFYSEAAANFRFFKDAWRNHVSHARTNYDARDAHRVLNHVADFMKHLATRA